ncbi:MAG TPA: Gfo/Idh/MocA family oxidoreductase [Candidatus Fimivivens sp.]|nr:Gfo/Idh/MocA family oxidoreductase [Candidatus Fimivivens sp.]
MNHSKILVLGVGMMGLNYVEKLLEIGIDPATMIGVDIDESKFDLVRKKVPQAAGIEFVKNIPGRPLKEFVNVFEIESVFLCTNTPSHHRLLVELMEHGITKIFCEKPLALNMDGVLDVQKAKMRTGANIFTAFLMNFSPALMHLIERMLAEDLVLIQGEASWGKNRFFDPRPTAGDLEDESVHPTGVFHTLVHAGRQEIDSIHVSARLSWFDYIDKEAQAKANLIDPYFPLKVNSSAFITESLRYPSVPFDVLLHTNSSYVKGKQVRRVECTFAKRDNPIRPYLATEMNFDTPEGDTLECTLLQAKTVEEKLAFKVNKLAIETKAFQEFVRTGHVDPRLTDYLSARMSVKVTKAIVTSDSLNGAVVMAYGDEQDLLFRKVVNG